MVLQLASEEESPDAQYALAVLAHTGEPRFNFARDLALELQLLNCAREMGYARAVDRLAQLYESGSEVFPPNVEMAIRTYQESGSAFAQGRLRVLRELTGPAGTTRRRSDSVTRPPRKPDATVAPGGGGMSTWHCPWWVKAGGVALVAAPLVWWAARLRDAQGSE